MGTLTLCLGNLTRGSNFAYPTKALPELQNEGNLNGTRIVLDEFEGSMFAATFGITGIIYAPLSGVIAGWLGRRKAYSIHKPYRYKFQFHEKYFFVFSVKLKRGRRREEELIF